MQNQFDQRTTGVDPAIAVGVPSVARDAGLRSYMLKVYNYMASGVLLTGIVAMLFVTTGAIEALFNSATGKPSMLYWVALFAPLGLVMWLQMGINRISERTAQALYWAYAALLGVSLSTIFVVYTGASIAQTFFATAAAFLGLSLYGYTTKKDLSGWGTFLIMGVVGLLVAMVVNIFLHSSAMDLLISAIGVLLFAGLTAYDTQKIKSLYVAGHGSTKTAVIGALQLYLDFINMFLFLLRFMGDRR